MAKKLKVWNGGGIYYGEYKNWHVNVCATSRKEAVEIMNKYLSCNYTASYMGTHFSDCWGNDMDGIEPTEPCLYVCEPRFKTRVKLF